MKRAFVAISLALLACCLACCSDGHKRNGTPASPGMEREAQTFPGVPTAVFGTYTPGNPIQGTYHDVDIAGITAVSVLVEFPHAL